MKGDAEHSHSETTRRGAPGTTDNTESEVTAAAPAVVDAIGGEYFTIVDSFLSHFIGQRRIFIFLPFFLRRCELATCRRVGCDHRLACRVFENSAMRMLIFDCHLAQLTRGALLF